MGRNDSCKDGFLLLGRRPSRDPRGNGKGAPMTMGAPGASLDIQAFLHNSRRDENHQLVLLIRALRFLEQITHYR
jgi:hypothetical protein